MAVVVYSAIPVLPPSGLSHAFPSSGSPNRAAAFQLGPGLDERAHEVTARSYTVNFSELGLPPGTPWLVTGFVTNSSTYFSYNTAPSSDSVALANGSFEFFVEPVKGFNATPVGGIFNVTGGALVIPIRFSPGNQTLESVPLFESGLANGTNWHVDLNGTVHSAKVQGSYGELIEFLVPNGTYSYTAGAGGQYVMTGRTASQTIDVTGQRTPYTVPFAWAYKVTITETGLPPGSGWWADVFTPQGLSVSNSTFIDLPAPNGTYNFSVGAVNPYLATADPVSGNFTVTGSNVSLHVQFTIQTYPVVFFETILPSGTGWWVNVTGRSSVGSDNETVTVSLPVGSYNYSTAVANKSFAPVSAGAEVRVVGPAGFEYLVPFYLVAYRVEFAEVGLPVGLHWSVTWNNSIVAGSGLLRVADYFPNGTYSFTVHPPAGYAATPASGRATISGGGIREMVEFSPVSAGAPPGGFFGLTWLNGVALFGGITVALIAVVILLWRRSFRSDRGGQNSASALDPR
ncbi:MAG TPA: hypothetical protein VGS23_02770 [Thermoplasmata archaeon]|nr:hypothetical protein [Thermoplasmata archaeon]